MNIKIAIMAGAALLPVATAQAEPAATEATGSIDVPAPPEGKGQIVFYRTGGPGFIMGCAVNENGEKVSSLGAGKYFLLVADPGPHSFTAESESKDTLNLEVESDETQYVRCKIKMGILMGRPNLAPSDKKTFDSQVRKLKMVDQDDRGPRVRAQQPTETTAGEDDEPARRTTPQSN